ncbi:hypothetical protein KKG65_01855, partial [Patescibacteria group bacterium]|nr:hypothetical protein [Patescibacteria group bacterium]
MRGLEKQEGLRDVLKPVWFRSKIFIFVVFLLVIISIIAIVLAITLVVAQSGLEQELAGLIQELSNSDYDWLI